MELKVNYKQVGALLRGPETEQMVRSYAEDIRGRAGDGYGSDARKLSTRWISTVYTASKETAQDNMEHNTLLKAMS